MHSLVYKQRIANEAIQAINELTQKEEAAENMEEPEKKPKRITKNAILTNIAEREESSNNTIREWVRQIEDINSQLDTKQEKVIAEKLKIIPDKDEFYKEQYEVMIREVIEKRMSIQEFASKYLKGTQEQKENTAHKFYRTIFKEEIEKIQSKMQKGLVELVNIQDDFFYMNPQIVEEFIEEEENKDLQLKRFMNNDVQGMNQTQIINLIYKYINRTVRHGKPKDKNEKKRLVVKELRDMIQGKDGKPQYPYYAIGNIIEIVEKHFGNYETSQKEKAQIVMYLKNLLIQRQRQNQSPNPKLPTR